MALPGHGTVVSYDECAIAADLSDVTLGDETYARAMHATLGGSKAVRHRAVLRSRRLRAIADKHGLPYETVVRDFAKP